MIKWIPSVERPPCHKTDQLLSFDDVNEVAKLVVRVLKNDTIDRYFIMNCTPTELSKFIRY